MTTEEERSQPWNLHSCRVCCYGSKSAFIMCKHVQIHKTKVKTDVFICDTKSPESMECEFCDFNTDLKVKLKEHYRVFHEGKEANNGMNNILKNFQCRNGDFETHSLLILINHEDNCNINGSMKQMFVPEKQWFGCAHCPYKSKQKSNLKRHIFSKHLKSEVLYDNDLECRQCLHKAKCKKHLKGYPEDTYWFKCEKCLFKSTKKGSLTTHILYIHSSPEDINWFKCTQCSFKTKYKHHLKTHLLGCQVAPEQINWFKCDKCSFKTTWKNDLTPHILRKHVRRDEHNFFKCTDCSFKTRHKRSLKLHFVVQHCNPGDFNWVKCSQCDFQTKHSLYLKRHILRIHPLTDYIKWFQCAQCPFKTKFKCSLKNHNDRHLNEDIKWFKCAHCSYKAKQKTHLQSHILNHQIRLGLSVHLKAHLNVNTKVV